MTMTENEYDKIIDECIDYVIKVSEELTRKYIKIAENEITELCRKAISQFYAKYEPHYYKRKDGLKKAFKVTSNEDNGTIEVNYSPDYMMANHRANNDYIFDISFIQGYHGGAGKGDYTILSNDEIIYTPHPNPGEMYWRKPPLARFNGELPEHPYSEWGRPAIQTKSPYVYIQERFPILEEKLNNRMQNEFNKKMTIMINKIKKSNEEFYGR